MMGRAKGDRASLLTSVMHCTADVSPSPKTVEIVKASKFDQDTDGGDPFTDVTCASCASRTCGNASATVARGGVSPPSVRVWT